ncbi:mitotic spindle checkpoint protein Bub3 [Collariella sp. IMI 366227]|nr:mitotic spindle checkpoint protein Bub3 [Collariella sp. IMI 366227]
MAPATQFEVAHPPKDAISNLVFAPGAGRRRLLVSSWDKNVYLYEVPNGGEEATLVQTYEHRAPVLDVCFGTNDEEAFTAGMDHQVKRIDLATGEQTVMSKHSEPVRCVVFSAEHCKPHAMASSPTKLVVAMTARLRESSLKFLTRAVACMPNDAGYATSSIEGRVAVEWFEDSVESQARKYAFKCHRQTDDSSGGGGDVVFPVNALAFHPVYGTFASGGGDGTVALWDAEAKRRMRQYQKFPESVAALGFSGMGGFGDWDVSWV